MPVGVGVGYTFESDGEPMCDLRAQFRWPQLVALELNEGTDTETFTVSVAARFYLYL